MSGVRRKSVRDIHEQLGRIIDHYGDDGNQRSERAYGIADRYVDNIYSTRQAQRDGRGERLNDRKYSRSTYMGLNEG